MVSKCDCFVFFVSLLGVVKYRNLLFVSVLVILSGSVLWISCV